jgi:hypothetical protein
MTADIKQFSDIVRTEHSNLPLVAFEHSIGLGADASHVQNHGALLAGAILCGTLGAIPGLHQTRYATAIHELHAFAIGPDASLPSQFFGSLLVGFNAPFIANVPNPTGSELAKDRTRAPRPDAPLSRPPFRVAGLVCSPRRPPRFRPPAALCGGPCPSPRRRSSVGAPRMTGRAGVPRGGGSQWRRALCAAYVRAFRSAGYRPSRVDPNKRVNGVAR